MKTKILLLSAIFLVQLSYAQIGLISMGVDAAKANKEKKKAGTAADILPSSDPKEMKLLKKVILDPTDGITNKMHEQNINKIIFLKPQSNGLDANKTIILKEFTLGDSLAIRGYMATSLVNYAKALNPQYCLDHKYGGFQGTPHYTCFAKYYVNGELIETTTLETEGGFYAGSFYASKSTVWYHTIIDEGTCRYPKIVTKSFKNVFKAIGDKLSSNSTHTLKIEFVIREQQSKKELTIASGEIPFKKKEDFQAADDGSFCNPANKKVIIKNKEFNLSTYGIAATIELPENAKIEDKGKDDLGDKVVVIVLPKIKLELKVNDYASASSNNLTKIIDNDKAMTRKLTLTGKLTKEGTNYYINGNGTTDEDSAYDFTFFSPLNSKTFLTVKEYMNMDEEVEKTTTLPLIEDAIQHLQTIKLNK